MWVHFFFGDVLDELLKTIYSIFEWWFVTLQLSLGNSSHFVPGESLLLFCSYWSNSLEVWQEELAQGSEGTAKASSQAGLWYQGTCEFLLPGLFLLNNHCSSTTVSAQPCQQVAFQNEPALRKHFYTVPNLATVRWWGNPSWPLRMGPVSHNPLMASLWEYFFEACESEKQRLHVATCPPYPLQ